MYCNSNYSQCSHNYENVDYSNEHLPQYTSEEPSCNKRYSHNNIYSPHLYSQQHNLKCNCKSKCNCNQQKCNCNHKKISCSNSTDKKTNNIIKQIILTLTTNKAESKRFKISIKKAKILLEQFGGVNDSSKIALAISISDNTLTHPEIAVAVSIIDSTIPNKEIIRIANGFNTDIESWNQSTGGRSYNDYGIFE
jgi:hypothetical protein